MLGYRIRHFLLSKISFNTSNTPKIILTQPIHGPIRIGQFNTPTPKPTESTANKT